MQQHANLKVSVTLAQDRWMAILEILRHACRLRGGGWIRWQQEIENTVMAALAAAEQETQEKRKVPVEPCRFKARPYAVPMEPWEAEWEIAEARFHEVVVRGRF